jgi:hypothetical protein
MRVSRIYKKKHTLKPYCFKQNCIVISIKSTTFMNTTSSNHVCGDLQNMQTTDEPKASQYYPPQFQTLQYIPPTTALPTSTAHPPVKQVKSELKLPVVIKLNPSKDAYDYCMDLSSPPLGHPLHTTNAKTNSSSTSPLSTSPHKKRATSSMLDLNQDMGEQQILELWGDEEVSRAKKFKESFVSPIISSLPKDQSSSTLYSSLSSSSSASSSTSTSPMEEKKDVKHIEDETFEEIRGKIQVFLYKELLQLQSGFEVEQVVEPFSLSFSRALRKLPQASDLREKPFPEALKRCMKSLISQYLSRYGLKISIF